MRTSQSANGTCGAADDATRFFLNRTAPTPAPAHVKTDALAMPQPENEDGWSASGTNPNPGTPIQARMRMTPDRCVLPIAYTRTCRAITPKPGNTVRNACEALATVSKPSVSSSSALDDSRGSCTRRFIQSYQIAHPAVPRSVARIEPGLPRCR